MIAAGKYYRKYDDERDRLAQKSAVNFLLLFNFFIAYTTIL